MASPSPTPPWSPALSPRKNSWNTRPRSSGRMPGPWSATATSTERAAPLAETSTGSPNPARLGLGLRVPGLLGQHRRLDRQSELPGEGGGQLELALLEPAPRPRVQGDPAEGTPLGPERHDGAGDTRRRRGPSRRGEVGASVEAERGNLAPGEGEQLDHVARELLQGGGQRRTAEQARGDAVQQARLVLALLGPDPLRKRPGQQRRHEDRDDEEGKQRKEVLPLGHGERPKRRREEEVQAEKRKEGCDESPGEPPGHGGGHHREEVQHGGVGGRGGGLEERDRGDARGCDGQHRPGEDLDDQGAAAGPGSRSGPERRSAHAASVEPGDRRGVTPKPANSAAGAGPD